MSLPSDDEIKEVLSTLLAKSIPGPEFGREFSRDVANRMVAYWMKRKRIHPTYDDLKDPWMLINEFASYHLGSLNAAIVEIARERAIKGASIAVALVITPIHPDRYGVLVKCNAAIWMDVVKTLHADWSLAYQIPPERWEEIIAATFEMAGFDKVVLTPRSGDHGRDVIATRSGYGSIKVIGSVKANKPGHLVRYDDVRALIGVMTGEHDTSKGIITTTSDFPPRITSDPFIAPFLPTRLELINGDALRDWLATLADI